MDSVPFTIDGVAGGLGTCRGLVHDEGDHLVLEYQTRDGLFGLALTGVREVRVPLADLAAVRLVPGWWGVKLAIQAKRLAVLQDVPGMTQGRVELAVARADVAAAERFVAGLHVPEEPPAGPAELA